MVLKAEGSHLSLLEPTLQGKIKLSHVIKPHKHSTLIRIFVRYRANCASSVKL